MKTRHLLLTLFLWSLLSASPVLAGRDPFWPIGYSPVSEKTSEPIRTQSSVQKIEAPREKPIAEEDWASARKALPISGTTKSVRPGTHETRVLVMINRQMFGIGDTVSLDHRDVRFQWRVQSITNSDVTLAPLQAERIDKTAPDLKQKKPTNASNLN